VLWRDRLVFCDKCSIHGPGGRHVVQRRILNSRMRAASVRVESQSGPGYRIPRQAFLDQLGRICNYLTLIGWVVHHTAQDKRKVPRFGITEECRGAILTKDFVRILPPRKDAWQSSCQSL